MAKRVLFVVHHFYPSNASGAHRPAKFAKYLPEYGWEPTVLCTGWTPGNASDRYDALLADQGDACRTVRVPFPGRPSRGLAYKAYRAAEILFPYRAPFGLCRHMLRTAEDLVREGAFRAIWSTYMPGFTHTVASAVARRHGLPWVADFRDVPEIGLREFRLRRNLKGEVRACDNASAMVTVSDPLAEVLRSRHSVPVHVITNGFDPADFPPGAMVPAGPLTIGYFGGLHFHRDPRLLFQALDALSADGRVDLDDVRVQFYGTAPRRVAGSSDGYRCRRIVECRERLPYPEMVEAESSRTLLLLLSSTVSKGIVTGKIFDYLGARRPILNIPAGDVTADILADTRAGVSASDVREVRGALKRWYDEWKRTGTVAYTGDAEAIARYSRREQARRLAGILDEVCQ